MAATCSNVGLPRARPSKHALSPSLHSDISLEDDADAKPQTRRTAATQAHPCADATEA